MYFLPVLSGMTRPSFRRSPASPGLSLPMPPALLPGPGTTSTKISASKEEANQETQLVWASMPPHFRILPPALAPFMAYAPALTAQMAAKSLSFPLEIEKALTHPLLYLHPSPAAGRRGRSLSRGAGWFTHTVS